MSSIVLFDDKKDCCGCGACMNVCPKNAIRMAEDEVGFVYPEIDQNLCIGCGACKKACGYQMQPMMQKSEAVYAAASNDDNLLRKSASGGAFAVLAENVLKKGGVVYGAALPLENGKLEPKHLRTGKKRSVGWKKCSFFWNTLSDCRLKAVSEKRL